MGDLTVGVFRYVRRNPELAIGLCLILTLVVVPVGYSFVEQAREYMSRRRTQQTVATAPAMGD